MAMARRARFLIWRLLSAGFLFLGASSFGLQVWHVEYFVQGLSTLHGGCFVHRGLPELTVCQGLGESQMLPFERFCLHVGKHPPTHTYICTEPYTYTHTFACTQMHATHMHIHIHTHTLKYTQHTCTFTDTHTHTLKYTQHTCTFTYTHTHTQIHTTHVHIHIHTHTHSNTHNTRAHSHTHTHTQIHTHMLMHTCMHAHTHTHT